MSESYDIKLEVEAYLHPTENIEKVKNAIENIFKDLNYQIKDIENNLQVIIGKASYLGALEKFRDLLKQDRIRDAARATMIRSKTDDSMVFYLNKQVAFVNHISFSMPEGESPLGPIKIRIRSKKLDSLIDWLAPRTKA
ncbi:RNA-binding domain-containing protein [[Eubacterium] cellulosolvens]